MRILHLSHDLLPDERIEKMAYTGYKLGHGIAIAARSKDDLIFKGIPLKFYTLPFSRYSNIGIPYFWRKLKKSLERILKQFKPDLIHAHNVIAGKLASETGIPFVYDDHEYWSEALKYAGESLDPFTYYKRIVWSRWEHEILNRAVVITTNEAVAREHGKRGAKTYVIPNFLNEEEVNVLQPRRNKNPPLSSVYVGRITGKELAYRNIDGLIKLFNTGDLGSLFIIGERKPLSYPFVYSIGFFPHMEMIKKLTDFHTGLIPWVPHPFHYFCSPNKAFQYAHAGLAVILSKSMEPVVNMLRDNCIVFGSFKELVELLKYYKENINEVIEIGIKTAEYARKMLRWEMYENQLINAYMTALQQR
jgi:glycosyltransferase involved in cell wall biosynthesis